MASIIRYLPFVICGSYVLIVVTGYRFCKYLEVKYKWVKRHWSFLDALSRDIQKVKDSVNETKKRASEFGESELNLEGITQPLQEIETQWVSKAGNVIWEAKRCIQYYENLTAMRTYLNSYLFVIFNLMSIVDLTLAMRRIMEEINMHFKEQKELTNKLCGLLEESRNRLRGLQDTIGKIESESLGSKVPFSPTLALALERLISIQHQNLIRGELAEQLRSTVIQVRVLQAFVKDLRWFKLESEMEKAWMKEAEDVIKEADEEINGGSEREAMIVRWPVAFGLRNWKAKRKIKKSVNYFGSRYSDLLEAKDRYGLRFIRRVSSKHVRRRLQRMDDEVISIALDNIRKQVPTRSAEYSQEPHCRIGSLCKQMEDIQQLLKDEKETEGARHARMACFHLLKKTATEAQECIKNYMEASPPKLVFEINRIHNAVDLLHKTVKVCTIQVIEDSCSVVGLEEDVHKFVSKLTTSTNDGSGGHPSVISIVGTKGIGKTTLAKEICNHRSILNHFKVCCFISLPHGDQYSNETLLLKNIRDQIMQTWDKGREKEYLIDEIRGFLKKQTCLVVLDDLRSKQAWNVLKQAFPDDSKSVVIITTRSIAVASHAKASGNISNIHRLRLQTGEESWEFLTQMVPFPSNSKGKIRSLAKKVVASTGGLPLAILRLGYLLSGKCLNEAELSRVLEREHGSHVLWAETWDINKERFQSYPILDRCFSYSEFFPRDFEIPSRRLIALWVASGLFEAEEIANDQSKQVHSSGDALEEKTRENTAYKCLLELVDRNMIQVVARKRNGNVKTCRFPSTLVEIWFRETRKNTITARSWSLFSSSDGQLAYRFDDKDANSGRSVHGLNSDIVFPEEKYPKSIMFFDTREGNEPGEDIGKFLLNGISSRRFEDLWVLDLEGVFRPQLPSSIGKLKKLTYLGLRWTYLENLPEFIGSLLQLETLDLKHTYVRELPNSSWKLKKLKNLYLNQSCRIKIMHHRSTISTKNLETLCGVFVDHEHSDLAINLGKFQSLQKLGITIFQLPVEQQKNLVKGIMELADLRSLTLRSIDEKGESQGLKLKSFKKLQKLTSLYLLGKLEKPAIISTLPESLVELTLSASGLKEDPMSKLGKLPKLKFLSFLSGSYQGPIMVCSKEDFPQLLVLHIWNLSDLEKLVVEVGAMPKLREFEVRSCKKLTFTTGLTNLKVLQVLTLKDMPDENAIENEFAAAKENSPDAIMCCPKINRNKEEAGAMQG